MAPEVRRRKVFYISGFDPRGARYYHGLYKEHSARQTAVNGLALDVTARKKTSPESHAWQAINAADTSLRTDVEFLAWDDIVRANWAQGLPALWRETWYCFKAYILTGSSFKFSRARKSWLKVAAYYQFLYLPLVFLLCLALFPGVRGAALGAGLHPLLAAGAGLGAGALLLWGAMAAGNRYAVFWLLRICAFSVKWARGEEPRIEARVNAFADRVRAALLAGEADEIMVVGHSVGSIIAVPVVLRALKGLPPEKAAGARIVLLTLGQCIPLVSFHPEGASYRAELAELAADPRVQWTDYSAPPDGASFPQLDPVAASGCDAPAGAGPRILSPRFFRLYRDETYRKLRYDWFNLHFLYLMSSDFPGEYDYFDITAGPRAFATRLASVTEGRP